MSSALEGDWLDSLILKHKQEMRTGETEQVDCSGCWYSEHDVSSISSPKLVKRLKLN